MEQERTRYAVAIPALGSLILTHSLHEQVPALKDFRKQTGQTPPLFSGLSA
jgi:cytochrome d ubiquinol oxidase subunit I